MVEVAGSTSSCCVKTLEKLFLISVINKYNLAMAEVVMVCGWEANREPGQK